MNGRKKLEVMPECYVDTNLIEYLLDAGVNNQHSCNKVIGQLNSTFSDKFAVGIIDKDKVEQGYVQECSVIAQTNHLTLMKHRDRCQFLILIAPAIEGFIIDCAQADGVHIESFGLSPSVKEFTTVSKRVTSNKDQRFKALFAALRQNSEITMLNNSLRYLCEKRYEVDVEELKGLFV